MSERKPPTGEELAEWKTQAVGQEHAYRTFRLVAEIERLRAEVERLKADLDNERYAAEECARLESEGRYR